MIFSYVRLWLTAKRVLFNLLDTETPVKRVGTKERRMRKAMVGLMLVGIISISGFQRAEAVPWIFQLGNQPNTVYGNYPINGTAATEYARVLITSYNALVDGKQYHWGNFSSIQRYYYLYDGNGNSWKLFVARENQTSPDDQIEFLFTTWVQGDQPQVNVVTNTTAQYLRPVVSSFSNPTASLLQGDTHLSYGEMLNDVVTNSSTGANYFPIIWITDLYSVYNDTYTNAHNAAQEIYNFDSQRGIQNSTSSTSTQSQTNTTTTSSIQGPPTPTTTSTPDTIGQVNTAVGAIDNWIYFIGFILIVVFAVKRKTVIRKLKEFNQ